MNEQRILRYFLGGNTGSGFYSLYDGFVSLSEGNFLWILKGGPGCGKSSFMKMIGGAAETAGFSVEYAFCSGDPQSLDGVFIPELKAAYVDGTAPHLTDANFAGVDSGYLNLGTFYDYAAIGDCKSELRELYSQCGSAYKKAYSFLAAAGELENFRLENFASALEIEAAVKRAGALALREFGARHRKKGRISRRFLSALSCRGLCCFTETAQTLCNRFYVFENRFRLGAPVLESLAESAVEAGYDIILCPNPLTPAVAEAVLIPAASLGFVCSDSALSFAPEVRNIRLDALIDTERLKKLRPELRRTEKLSSELQNEGISALAEAKRLHDQIEGIFNPNVDFDGVNSLVREQLAFLGLK